MKLCWFVSFTLLITIHTAHSQQATTFPEHLKGNWFLEQNTNDWIFGVYDKFVYYKNDFWPYRILSSKENETRLLLQKNGVVHNLSLIAQNDSVIQVNSRGVVQTVTSTRRRMAAPEQTYTPVKSNTVYIKGYIDHIDETEQRIVSFGVEDLLLGKAIPQSVEADKNGCFTIRLSLPSQVPEITLGFDDVRETLILNPGDTATLYFDAINSNLVVGGKPGAFNNEFRDYMQQVQEPGMHMTMIRNIGEQLYMSYELNRQRRADSLLVLYKERYTMSERLFERVKQSNKYQLPYSLLRYVWLYKDKRVVVSPEYRQLVNSFTTIDSNAKLGGYNFLGFVHELMNATVWDHFSDSLVLAHSSPGRAFDYIQQYDKAMSPALLKDIDRLLKYSPRFVRLNGKLSLNFHATDTIFQNKIITQFNDLLSWMSNNDYFVSYFANLQLAHKLTRIDSLYPKSPFRDYLLGHYCYSQCLDNSRLILDDNSLDKLRSMCNDTAVYNLVAAENRQNKQQFETARYENLVANTSAETVLNRIARQHKGKAVYIDIWATWSVPSMEQFPYTKELKKVFEGKPIDLVYLCCDSDITDWQNMIRKYALPGQHLLLTTVEKKALQTKYKFGSYPRYMIIDKQGKLISSNSFAPQQKEMVVPMMEGLVK